MSKWTNLGIIVIVVVIAVGAYYFYQPSPAPPVNTSNFDSELQALEDIFSSKGLAMESLLVVDESFYALQSSELISLKQDLTAFSASSDSDFGQLADAFVFMVDYAIKRNELNQKVAFISSLDSDSYCENFDLFVERDNLGKEVVLSLQHYQQGMNSFVEAYHEDLVGLENIEVVELNLDSPNTLQL